MTSQMTVTTRETGAPVPKPPKSFSVSLRGADGDTLRISAVLRKDGSASTFAVHGRKDAKGKKTNARGATERHTSVGAAKAAMEKLVKLAVAKGWERKERSGRGFTAAPDQFGINDIPKPSKPSKK